MRAIRVMTGSIGLGGGLRLGLRTGLFRWVRTEILLRVKNLRVRRAAGIAVDEVRNILIPPEGDT